MDTIVDRRQVTASPLATDPRVRYFKSFLPGRPCYYLVWSGIEQIFVKKVSDWSGASSVLLRTATAEEGIRIRDGLSKQILKLLTSGSLIGGSSFSLLEPPSECPGHRCRTDGRRLALLPMTATERPVVSISDASGPLTKVSPLLLDGLFKPSLHPPVLFAIVLLVDLLSSANHRLGSEVEKGGPSSE